MKIINLLPKLRQQELSYVSVFHGLAVIFVLSLLSFGLVIFGQAATRFYLQTQSKSLDKQIADLKEQIKKNENSEVKAKVKAANDLVLDFKNLAALTPRWSKVIKAFVVLPPEGVKINSFVIDTIKKTINITGFSPTRELVDQIYKNILNDTKEFYNIDYPFENVAKPKEVNFHFTFNIKDELLKQ